MNVTRVAAWLIMASAAAPALGASRCNTFIGGARGFEAQCRGQWSGEVFSTWIGGEFRSWQHSAGVQYGIFDGVELESFGTVDVAPAAVRLAQFEVNAHWDVSHGKPWPTRVGLEWIVYERELEGDAEARHRTGAAFVVGRYWGDLAIAANVGIEIPEPEVDIGILLRHPLGEGTLSLALVDEPDAGDHLVVAWPEIAWEVTPRLGVAVTAGIGLTPEAPPLAVRAGLDLVWR